MLTAVLAVLLCMGLSLVHALSPVALESSPVPSLPSAQSAFHTRTYMYRIHHSITNEFTVILEAKPRDNRLLRGAYTTLLSGVSYLYYSGACTKTMATCFLFTAIALQLIIVINSMPFSILFSVERS